MKKQLKIRAVVVVQLIELLLPTKKVSDLNPVISKLLYVEHLFTLNCIEKTKIKKKRPVIAHVVTKYS